jgi:hypothetical protein
VHITRWSTPTGSPTTASWTTLPPVCESLESRNAFAEAMLGDSVDDATRAAEAAGLAVSVLEDGDGLPTIRIPFTIALWTREGLVVDVMVTC